MNNVILMGRLVRDPEIRTGKDDFIVATYTLAVDRPFKNSDGEREADFIRCQAFGRSAEFVETYLVKGMLIAVNGSLRTGSYENKEGERVYTTDVVVYQHFFTGTARGSDREEDAEETKHSGKKFSRRIGR